MTSQNSKKLYFAKKLTRYYSSALLLIAALTIIGQVLIQTSIYDQRNDSELINIAGKQRMLSQKLSRLVMQIKQSTNESEKELFYKKLQANYKEWVNAEEYLTEKFSRVHDDEFQKRLRKQKLRFRDLEHRINGVIEAKDQKEDLYISKQKVDTINDKADRFLKNMDSVVFSYEEISEKKVTKLSVIEYILLFLTLLVLTLEGLFLFKPITRFINNSFIKLIALNIKYKKEKEKAERLANTNNELIEEIGSQLRTPLNSISRNTEIILRGELSRAQTNQVRTIGRSAECLADVINNAIDKAEIKTKQVSLESNEFSLKRSLDEIVEFLKPKAKDKQLNFIYNREPSVPDKVSGDSARLKQALISLTEAVIKNTPDGHIFFNIKSFLINDNEIHLGFIVEGSNADEAYSNSNQKSSEILIAEELATMLGGNINQSTNNKTNSNENSYCFNLILQRGRNAKTKVNYHQLTDIRHQKVLIVDGNKDNYSLTEEHLTHMKVSCKVVKTSNDAMKELQKAYEEKDPYTIALVDYQIQGTDGLKLAQAIKQSPDSANIKLLMLSNNKQKFNLVELEQAGFEGYLIRPVKSSALSEVLAGIISELNNQECFANSS